MNKIVKVNWRDVDIIGKALSVTYSDGSGGFLPVPEYRNHIIDRIAALENSPDKGRPEKPRTFTVEQVRELHAKIIAYYQQRTKRCDCAYDVETIFLDFLKEPRNE